MSEPRPISPPDHVTASFWEATREQHLMIQRCAACNTVQHYPRGFCAACGIGEPRWIESSGRGVIVSHTTVHRAPHPAFTPPYVVALVRLAEGPVMLTNIVGCAPDDVHCDQPVRVTWEPLPDDRNLPLFTPDR